MLQLTHPERLFFNQKVMKINAIVEKNTAGVELKGLKGVVVVFSSPKAEFLQGAEREQLMKIINACKLKEEDVLLVNTAFAKNADFNWLKNTCNARVIIVFGDIKLSANLQLRKHFAYSIDNLHIVKSDEFNALFSSPPAKKALWDELRHIFGI